MTGLRRTLGLCFALAAFESPIWALRFDELQDTFRLAVEQLQRGHKDEALRALQKVIASSPDQKAAYEMWKSTDYRDWRDMLVEGGEMELAARRLIDLAGAERKALRNDKDAIVASVSKAITSEDPIERRLAIRTLSADHGEYAVPYLLPYLADGGDEDKRVLAMHGLAQMSTDVVVPLVEALQTKNPVMRRNIAHVLGNIGDARSTGALQSLAETETDPVVKQAAAAAVAKLAPTKSALENLLKSGDDYYLRRDTALRFGEAGDVVWDWKDDHLVAVEIPRQLYSSEMSKRQYYAALAADPQSTPALAGLARAYVEMQNKIDAMVAAGQDPKEWKNTAGQALTAVNAAGADALDLALKWSTERIDASTGGALCRVLAPLAKGPTPGLTAALKSSDGALRSEAAVALGSIAARMRTNPGAEVVAALGEAAGREVIKVAVVISDDVARSESAALKLEKMNVYVNRSNSGARALGMLRRAPHVDLVLVADALPDMTTAQVVDEIRADERFANTAIVLMTNDDAAAANFGDRIQGAMKGEDTAAVEAALSKEMTGDRALAEDLATRSSAVLAQLGALGMGDLSAAQAGLVNAVGRADKTAIPAMQAIGASGGPAEAAALVAALTDEKRSDEARTAAGRSLSNLLGRHGNALDAAALEKVQSVVSSAASMGVREAAAQAIGSISMDGKARADLLRKLRG
ncbi:MAG: HEAT repeat domain-containing protein [Planctomycetota bacterium]|nr:HEAT repeat domain-containing protein [Planctomycetota bacterium]